MGHPSTGEPEPGGEEADSVGVEAKVLWQEGARRPRKKNMKGESYFSADVTEFLYLLAKHGVRYLIVGGEAVVYYGYARLTGDIDLLYERTDDNSRALYDVLREFWDGAVPGLRRKDELMREGMILQFGVPPNRIDLLNSIDGVKFPEAWEHRRVGRLSPGRKKFSIYYIGLEDLIKNKKAIHRDKDKDDLRFLTKVKRR